MTEYLVQSYDKHLKKWVKATAPGITPRPTTDKDHAVSLLTKIPRKWLAHLELLERSNLKKEYNDTLATMPTEFRLVSREVSEWVEVTQ